VGLSVPKDVLERLLKDNVNYSLYLDINIHLFNIFIYDYMTQTNLLKDIGIYIAYYICRYKHERIGASCVED